MPTYEYECDACDHKFEVFHSMSAEPIKKCPKCGKNRVRRLIGCGAGIIFKGSGFYCTDYRSDSYRTSAKNDKSSSTASSAKGDSSSSSNSSSSSSSTSPSGSPTPATSSSSSDNGTKASSSEAGGNGKACKSKGTGGSPRK